MSATRINHGLEMGNRQVLLSERCADDFKPETYVSPWKKGQAVVLALETMTKERDNYTCTGRLEPLTD